MEHFRYILLLLVGFIDLFLYTHSETKLTLTLFAGVWCVALAAVFITR